jgi:hypothetical protein
LELFQLLPTAWALACHCCCCSAAALLLQKLQSWCLLVLLLVLTSTAAPGAAAAAAYAAETIAGPRQQPASVHTLHVYAYVQAKSLHVQQRAP